MQGKTEQKNRGERSTDTMPGNIDKSVKGEKHDADQCGQPIALIGSFAQRKDPPNQQRESNNRERDGRPTHLAPKPEPIAFRMQRARVGDRRGPKNCKHRFEISEADSAPGRVANEVEGVVKNAPAKIRRDAGVRDAAKMKALQGLAAKKEQRRQQKQDE